MSQTALPSGVEGSTVEACPECDSSSAIVRRMTSRPESRLEPDDADYRCEECKTEFDAPNVRPRKGGLGLHGVALFLFSVPPDADLEELPDLYDEWGGSECKLGFDNGDNQ